jgi:hypothetical protein
MAVTKDAGGSVHHVVLLWPFPVFFAVMALNALPGRWTLPAIAGALVLLNLTALNQYFSQIVRYGADGPFSDAYFPLAKELERDPGNPVYLADWGLADALLFKYQGRLNVQDATYDLHADSRGPEQTQTLVHMIADPEARIVNHVEGREMFPHNGRRLAELADSLGYRRETIRTIADSNGRPVFEIVRFSKVQGK